MRSPVIAFGIFAAAAVSPSLVCAAPTSPNVPNVGSALSAAPHPPNAPASVPHMPRELNNKHSTHKHKHKGRAEDFQTAGGQAYSGASGNVSGGDVVNSSDDNDNAITNTDASELNIVLLLEFY